MLRLLMAVVVGAAVVGSVVASAVRVSSQVPAESLDAAAERIRADYRPGDLVAVVPYWQVGPRSRLGDLALEELRQVRADDVRSHGRIHLLELDAVGASSRYAEALSTLTDRVGESAWPGVRLSTLKVREPDRTVFALRSDLQRVHVRARYADGASLPCDAWVGGTWRCPRGSDWSYVGPITTTVDSEPRACVWAHPIEAGGTLSLELPPVAPRVGGYEVVLGAGFTMSGARAARAPVDVRLVTGAVEPFSTRFPVAPEWRWHRIALPAQGPLVVELSTRDNGAAHFCVDLRIVEAS